MMDYGTIIQFRYGAEPDQFEIDRRPKIVPYDPDIHPELPMKAGELVPLGEIETVIIRWDLPDPQPTLEELEPHEADALAWKQTREQEVENERLSLSDLGAKADKEIGWLTQAISDLPTMSEAEKLSYLERIGRQNRAIFKALKYVVRPHA